ncbi:MAG: DinB family protein [Clostridiaceae bacterium]|jgi:uncharacterized damage-inducible protein DinB|nr:DinB family protein [Clostridiaceae bacterium]
MARSILDAARTHFEMSLKMLQDLITKCPDELWNEKRGGYVFWQQILHALSGVDYWMRLSSDSFVEPFAGKVIYPELESDPVDSLSKDELQGYSNKVAALCKTFFAGKDDAWLREASVLYDRISNMDIVFMLVRHMQYHTGHCDSILRESGFEPVEWVDYFGD